MGDTATIVTSMLQSSWDIEFQSDQIMSTFRQRVDDNLLPLLSQFIKDEKE